MESFKVESSKSDEEIKEDKKQEVDKMITDEQARIEAEKPPPSRPFSEPLPPLVESLETV